MPKAKVLMVEDNINDQKTVGILLSDAFEFRFAESLALAKSYLKNWTPNIVLLDLNLPDSRGMDTLSDLIKDYPDMPIVVWSGAGDAAEAIRRGAEDFLLKDGVLKDVTEALTGAIARHKFSSVKEDIAGLRDRLENDKKLSTGPGG